MSEAIDFQPYLRSIREKYEKWDRFYTPTDAQHQRSGLGDEVIEIGKRDNPLLLFERMAAIVSPKRPGDENDDQESKPPKKISVLQGLRKYAKERVLLVGRPGLGKSTTLQQFLFEEVKTAQEAQHPKWIPILVELRYWEGSPFDRLRASLQRHDRNLNFSDTDLDRELRQGRFLLLFDGLNELPSKTQQKIRQFCYDYPYCPMVGTTRDLSLGGSFGIEKQLEMLPLDDWQVQQFIRAYLSERAEAMLRGLKTRLRTVGRTRFEQTPLLLMMLCGVFRHTGEIPDNLGLLFREFARSYERHLKQDVPVCDRARRWWQPLLTHLGEYMMRGEKPTEFRVAIPKTEVRTEFERWLQGRVNDPGDRADECLKDLLKHSLLQVQMRENGENIEFLHQLIQEYYAAEALRERLRDLNDAELKREYLNYLKWTEPVALMLALVGDEALRVVRLALEVDYMLGARLAGEVKREFQERTVEMVSGLDVLQWLKVKLWGETRSDFAIPGLLQALQDKEYSVRILVLEALEKLSSQKAISGCFQALKDEDFRVRRRALEALEKLSFQNAISSWLQALEYRDTDVREKAAEALGKLGSEAALPDLCQAVLKDEDSGVRRRAAEALENLISEAAIWKCVQTLIDEEFYDFDSYMDRHMYRIENQEPQAVIEELVRDVEWALEYDTEDEEDVYEEYLSVIIFVAEIFGKMYAEDEIWDLLLILQDKGFYGSTVQVFYNLRLLPTLKNDRELGMLRNVTEALENPNLQRTIPGLLRPFEEQDFWIPKCEVWVSENQGSEAKILSLLQALKHENYYMRGNAAQVLGHFKDDRAAHILPNLLTLIPTESGEAAFHALTAIQANCKFYDYDIFHSQLIRKSEIENSSGDTTNIYNVGTLNAPNSSLNLGGTIHGNQSSTQNPKP